MSPLSPPCVLVVDDDAAVRDAIAQLIELEGGAPVQAGSVEEARAAVQRAGLIAAAFIDKNLPDGSGIELLRELRALSPETDAVMITGAADVASAVEALRLG